LANRARAAADRARYLRGRAGASGLHRQRLLSWADRYERLSTAEAARSEVAASRGRPAQLRAIARAISAGAYRPQRSGGCGGFALVQDTGLLIAPEASSG
jgi:hypothetical protein